MKHIKEYKQFLLEQETYTDYPAAASKNAQQALDWRDEHGRDEVDAGLRVGWMRANQLANKEAISADTVKRMSAFNRHRKNSKIAADLKDTPWKDRGYVAWLLWGGDEGVDWAMKKSKEIDKANESRLFEEKAKGDRGPIDDSKIETGLKKKAADSGVPIGLLRIVMRRGMDAWNSGHRPGVTQQAWGYARVNAFLEKGKGTWQNADKDVAKEVRDGGHDKKLPYKEDANESIVEGKVKPTDDTIRFHIDAYRVDDDPYEVAQEIGKEYGWTEREIQKAEKLIRKKYLR